ncbi:MAG TPA: histidine kinase, partial [Aggregicoccus sp.]|nr:histidine kinase [Aggregicoccus sp.]
MSSGAEGAMTVGLWGLLGLTLCYLLVLVAIANAADRGGWPTRLARHPLVIALSLGVYATAWSYYGSVGFAKREGVRYLTIYMGVTLACLLVPQVWAPLQRLVRARQFSSLADVLAFRFHSQAAGVLVTVFLLAGSLPYITLQLRALVETAVFLSPGAPRLLVGAFVTAALILFAILFGARHVTPRERHAGLVLAIAFESAVKAVALLAVSAWAYFGPLGGAEGVARLLAERPELQQRLAAPAAAPGWGTLLLLSACAGFLQPRQFHLAFVEARGAASL